MTIYRIFSDNNLFIIFFFTVEFFIAENADVSINRNSNGCNLFELLIMNIMCMLY